MRLTLLFALLAGLALFVAVEVACGVFLRRLRRDLRLDPEGDFRMEPHIFTHFMPSARSAHAAALPSSGASSGPAIYLAGDCTLFEEHLTREETFAYQLLQALPGYRVINAGTDHYTALHSYNRLVVDLLHGHRPRFVLLHSAANDVLSFIHHKDGVVKPDHSHMYRPWLSQAELLQKVSRIPTTALKLILLRLLWGGNRPAWDNLAEEISPKFQSPENTAMARRLFDPAGFLTVLDLLEATCRTAGSTLVLTTYSYQPWDMIEEPRLTYAWGIDRLNEEIRKFARARNIPLIDLAEEMVVEGDDILNKWHYTLSGNRKRAEITARRLRALETTLLPEGARHAAAR